jgi:anhydro-N-acetylmuramic acid kinase
MSVAHVAIGVMSGTSMDGIDVALIESDGEANVRAGPSAGFAYPEKVAGDLRAAVADPVRAAGPLGELERAVTDAHVAAVEGFLAKFGLARQAIAVVGLHGQTVLHRPREGFTRQLCDGARASRALGLDVVCDFRSADIAAGGEGAPLIPLYHAAIAAAHEKPLMLLNWGGVGNVTYLGADGEILAFDTGPANALIDDFLRARLGLAFDEGGRLAASGRVHDDLLHGFLAHPYFERPAPKSLDRNQFHAALKAVADLSDADGAATLSAFTVEATAAALRNVPEPPRRWVVCGGGRKNATLMGKLASRLNAPVEPIEAIGFDGDAIEAQGFAYLALRAMRGLPLSLPTTTGVSLPLTGGILWRAPRAANFPRF